MVLNFLDKMQAWIEPVREFIFKHHGSPFFWLIIFLIALAVFFIGFSALNKEHQL